MPKANPGSVKACTEVGAYTYYELLAFEKAAGIDLDLVDVGSASDKVVAMLSKQVDLMPAAYLAGKDYLEAGQFVIFLPGEAHSPGGAVAGPEPCRKLIVKVRCDPA